MPDWGRTTLELIVQELQRPVRVDESFDRRVMVRVRRMHAERRSHFDGRLARRRGQPHAPARLRRRARGGRRSRRHRRGCSAPVRRPSRRRVPSPSSSSSSRPKRAAWPSWATSTTGGSATRPSWQKTITAFGVSQLQYRPASIATRSS